MKEFIEKLIGRLEERKTHFGTLVVVGKDDLVLNYNLGKMHSLEDAIEIVNQLAEEHKGGWIPCSEQEEPTENGQYIVSVQHYSNKDLYDVCLVDWFGEWKVSYEWNVLAWMPLPEPYQKEGEADD